jgi:predicted AAA+ superfamily ATPase
VLPSWSRRKQVVKNLIFLGLLKVPVSEALQPEFTFRRPYVILFFMIKRPVWNERLAAGWKQAPIVWLTGPRRVGKTVLAQSLPDAEFLNCDLPSVAERLRDPESFYRSVKKGFVVFDEIHQLPDQAGC